MPTHWVGRKGAGLVAIRCERPAVQRRPALDSKHSLQQSFIHQCRRHQSQFRDRKSTRLNSSHGYISYAVFCLKKKSATAVSSAAITVKATVLTLSPPPFARCSAAGPPPAGLGDRLAQQPCRGMILNPGACPPA